MHDFLGYACGYAGWAVVLGVMGLVWRCPVEGVRTEFRAVLESHPESLVRGDIVKSMRDGTNLVEG